jgi:hypothetical protein
MHRTSTNNIGSCSKRKNSQCIKQKSWFKLKLIRDIHCGMMGYSVILQNKLTSLASGNMKFAPITSVEVERSFSRYKSVLRQTVDNLT